MSGDALVATLDLPRANGELVFDEPWQARALGIGAVEWRDALADAITRHGYDPQDDPASAYYAAWVDALERLVAAHEH